MKSNLILLVFTVLTIACKKNSAVITPEPVSDFTITNLDSVNGSFTIGTYDELTLQNKSTSAVSYSWDFGNDSISSMENPTISYKKAGTYKITLTAKNADSVAKVSTRSVTVLNRIIKQVRIIGTTVDNSFNNHQLDTLKGKIWAVLKLGDNGIAYTKPTDLQSQSYSAPILFQTPAYNLSGATFPLVSNVTSKIVLNYPATKSLSTLYGYSGIGYGLELFGQDDTGTYLLSTSYANFFQGSGGFLRILENSIRLNSFVLRYANVDILCTFEQ